MQIPLLSHKIDDTLVWMGEDNGYLNSLFLLIMGSRNVEEALFLKVFAKVINLIWRAC